MTQTTSQHRIGIVVLLCLLAGARCAEKETAQLATTQPAAVKTNTAFGQKQSDDAPMIEVCFVLDTTGSMGSLIQGAKDKIWAITNQILQGKPRPKVRLALVPYRDKGDQYVTQVFDLTDNIDKVYADLIKFKANGGGDTPENVNQGLHDAINKVKWTKKKGVTRLIFIVGDCPPHPYKELPSHTELATEAVKKGIYVNTVLCGNNQNAKKVWQEIAARGEGKFFQIGQSGDVEVIKTPFDADLAKLNGKLDRTVVVYGSQTAQQRAMSHNSSSLDASSYVQAERVKNASLVGRGGSGDLVEKIVKKEVKLEDVKKDHLPKEMQKMSTDEQKKYIAKKQTERETILKQVVEISKKRDAHIKAEQEKRAKTGKAKAGFDQKVLDAIRIQSKDAGVKY
jgi:hypothetical protein